MKENRHRGECRGEIEPVKMSIRKVDKPPYVVDNVQLSRYDQKNTVFKRVLWDQSWQGYGRMIDEKVQDIISENKNFSRILCRTTAPQRFLPHHHPLLVSFESQGK